MNSPFMSPPHAYASYLRDRSVPATLLRSRSPTLPLDEDAGGERGQGTYNKELMSIYDTASHEHRGNAAGKATTRRLQNGKSTARRVLKPVSSRISKTSPKERVLRHGTPRQQHEAAHSGEKMGNSQKTRQVEPQDSNFTSPATFPIHQADEPGNLNDQPYSCDQELQSHRESIDIHREGAQRATSSRTRALESKLSIKRNAESPASSKIPKRSRRNPAQGARHKKQKDERKIPRENKTRRGRVSKRPEKYGFTWE
ncbi:MAG: hypothetical protein L6R39_006021 [Caloplaca ligustica]|nr:MAG: hypothetical protein L6R39_006021 [Caloplaca ligustica]